MARNEEKAQSMLYRFREAQAAELGLATKGAKRPRMASACKSLRDCERWRGEILREISRKVSKIQDAGLTDYEVRDLNDEINRLMREKRHWENQIIALGGANYRRNVAMVDEDGQEVPGTRGYKYFGRARELPGVKELFQKKTSKEDEESHVLQRYKQYLDQPPSYTGDEDEEDGTLLAFEREAEEEDWAEAYASLQEALGLPQTPPSEMPIPPPEPLKTQAQLKEGEEQSNPLAWLGDEINPPKMPTEEEMEKVLLEMRKQALLREYGGE
ncbi:Isy1-like splicing factor [Calocera cornea HHB12733]|uniref:Isy1-like splicing factor n=1 Tax=Calocera cornea HHB12733 TaxID=1353952 RepID=A0A165C6Q8_9BASI|nr:Isy1-like splicing factor [Calocera cornea HHB12733]